MVMVVIQLLAIPTAAAPSSLVEDWRSNYEPGNAFLAQGNI
jgi:hypothetical protein